MYTPTQGSREAYTGRRRREAYTQGGGEASLGRGSQAPQGEEKLLWAETPRLPRRRRGLSAQRFPSSPREARGLSAQRYPSPSLGRIEASLRRGILSSLGRLEASLRRFFFFSPKGG